VLLSTGAFRKYRSTAGTRSQSPQLWIDRLSSCPGGAQQQTDHTQLLLSIDGTDRQKDGLTVIIIIIIIILFAQ